MYEHTQIYKMYIKILRHGKLDLSTTRYSRYFEMVFYVCKKEPWANIFTIGQFYTFLIKPNK